MPFRWNGSGHDHTLGRRSEDPFVPALLTAGFREAPRGVRLRR